MPSRKRGHFLWASCRVPHPRILCEGGVFDFRPHLGRMTQAWFCSFHLTASTERCMQLLKFTIVLIMEGAPRVGFTRGVLIYAKEFEPMASASRLLGRPAIGRRSTKHRSAISQSNLAGARHL